MSLSPGARLGHYEVVGALGAGGMGVVYRARDTRLRRDVALKLLATGDDEQARARLMHEARAAAALNHPHICTVHEVGEAGGTAFIAMEVVEGETLEHVIRRGHLSPDRVCRIGRQIAEALEHAHAHGVIHRDLKSANVVVGPAGRAKILDFGIAERQQGVDTDTHTATAERATLAGTLAYMAPEVLRGADATVQSDIWSLGVVLYEMTAGRLPHSHAASSDLVAAVLRDAPPALPSGTPPALARIIMKCLAKEPGERPGRAGEVALALDVAEPRAGEPDVEPGVGTGADRVRARRGLRLVHALAIVAPIGVAAAVYWTVAVRDSAPQPPRLGNPVQVTTDVGVEDYADWSPDGRTLAYAANPSGDPASENWDIWVTQGGGTRPVNRTADHPGRDLFPSWSPNGTQIAFWSDRNNGGCYVMPALGGAARKVFATGTLDPNAPQWSADGTAIGCVASPSPADVDLHWVSLATSQSLSHHRLPGEFRRSFVSATRDQRAIALVASSAGLSSDLARLWVFDTRSGTRIALTDGQSKVVSPNWSADGRTLFYVAHSGATMDLWQQALNDRLEPQGPPTAVTAGLGIRSAALSRDGRRLVYSQGRRIANVWRVPILGDRAATWSDAGQVTFDQAYIECVDVSRDGRRLAVSSDRSGTFDLWALPALGGEMQRLTTDPSAEWCPRWSPDDTTLVFYAHRTGNRDIWTMPAQGGEWTQVTTNPGPDLHPSWSNDGKEIVYLAAGPQGSGAWVSPALGGQPRRVLDSPLAGSAWSPTDRRIAILDRGRLWMVDADGTMPPRLLIERPMPMTRPRWDPNGRTLYFVAGGESVLALNADGTGERIVATLSGRRGSLGSNGLSVDGRYLYFTWEEDLGDLWTLDVQSAR